MQNSWKFFLSSAWLPFGMILASFVYEYLYAVLYLWVWPDSIKLVRKPWKTLVFCVRVINKDVS